MRFGEDADTMSRGRGARAAFDQAEPGSSERWRFDPHPGLRNPHLMTLFPHYWPRPFLLRGLPVEPRLFRVSSDTQLLGFCHWQADPKTHPTLILLHGLEGSSESHYMRGIAAKAWRANLNVVRLNQRSCGRSEPLAPGLYHGGLSEDLRFVVSCLARDDGLESIWIAGYSLGGNIVLKLAGEVGRTLGVLQGAVTICPNIDPAACVTALESPSNSIYHHHFVRSLKARMRRKERLFPGRFELSKLSDIRTLRTFDEIYTAPAGGFSSADDYYDRSGARHVLAAIDIPTLILVARDDPFVPFAQFHHPGLTQNPWIRLVAPPYGGHCGFSQKRRSYEDRFWGENRLLEFIMQETPSGVP